MAADAYDVPQEILDALTRVDMPAVPAAPAADGTVEVLGREIPVRTCGCLVLGSGAAGLRAAVEAKRRGVDVLIATMSPFGGTSACSGSDKQTLHTAGTSLRGDHFVKLADAIGAGGCMDHDTAYIEAVGSVGAFAGLQYLGLPLPQDRFGAVLRYRTDHDEVGRATSCGPRTSRLMVRVLCDEALRLGIPFLRKCEGVRLLVEGDGDARHLAGVLCVDQERRGEHWGLTVIRCGSCVLATGGPGELYRDSVYPPHCYGSLGMALEAGVEATNLTESQFGIGTRRDEFPWNLSGTYVQVLPYIYSVDEEGREYNFLADYYRTTRELASNVFRKGYQWPFHATRMEDFGSSLVDLAIFVESRKGRTILMDFNRNPEPGADGEPFDLDDLDDDARAYLANNDAVLPTPIERLRRMNPLAIELYKMHGRDITADPLPFNVNNQHMNGGVAVDVWNRSSLEGCYAVGEVAGTHGVTRPGGAALNGGQVGAVRCADHIAACDPDAPPPRVDDPLAEQIADAIEAIEAALGAGGGRKVADVRAEIQARMSDRAGFICMVDDVPAAHEEARNLRRRIYADGLRLERVSQVVDLFRWRHLALVSEAVLRALDRYVGDGGGSRGARAYCSRRGEVVFDTVAGPIHEYRYHRENPDHRVHKLILRFDGEVFSDEKRPLREREDLTRIFFEKNWSSYLTGAIYEDGFRHG